MISLPELRAKALRRYPSVPRAHLVGEAIFPLPIPTNKVLDRSQGHEHIHAQQKELIAHAKNRTGHGYWLTIKLNRKTGQSEINRIEFETLTDYLSFVHKAAEFAAFEINAALTVATVPALLPLPALPPCCSTTPLNGPTCWPFASIFSSTRSPINTCATCRWRCPPSLLSGTNPLCARCWMR